MTRAFTLVSVATIALSTAGCFLGDRVATRTLTIYQVQNAAAYHGPFEIDASGLPPDAIESREDREVGAETSLVLKPGYAVKVLLVPATQPDANRQPEPTGR